MKSVAINAVFIGFYRVALKESDKIINKEVCFLKTNIYIE